MSIQRSSEAEQQIRRTTWAFADGRFEKKEVVEWALALTSDQETERSLLRDLYSRQQKIVREPYALAWRCIFEYWRSPDGQTANDAFLIKRELRQGAHQRETIKLIVDAVRPWLKVETARRFQVTSPSELPKKPKHLKHLLYASISSGSRLSPGDVGLSEISDRDFLLELATALNAAVLSGLILAKMIGSISKDMDITNWLVRRVYFVPPAQHPEGGGEPDRYSDGFAPSIKLMFASMERLAEIDVDAASRVVASWDVGGWTVYRRLWAAAARDPRLAEPTEVASFLTQLDDREFWNAGSYPEFAELRAVRWNTLVPSAVSGLERRLLKGEPAKQVPSGVPKDEIPNYKRRHIVNELRRIEAGGGVLSPKASLWLERSLNELDADQLPDAPLTLGFNQGVRLVTRDRTISQTFNGIGSSRLLDELAKSLSDDGWDDRSENAADFIGANAATILKLLSDSTDTAIATKIWQAFGHRFRPTDLNVGPDRATAEDANKVPVALQACRTINRERPDVLMGAVEGLTTFINNWDRLLGEDEDFRRSWLTLWPYAVMKSNERGSASTALSNRAFGTPVGQMIWAMIGMSPRIRKGENPMSEGLWPAILSAVENAEGEAKLEAQYVLVRDIGYFYAASPDWASRNLVMPLITSGSADLWEAFGTGNLPQYDLMRQIAEAIVKATTMSELPSKTKRDLAERIIWSTIFDRKEGKVPAVPLALTQQMLRMGGDEVRSQVVRSLIELLKKDDDTFDQKARFDLAKSIFQDVWPKELTLSSRTVSEELAELPAAAGEFYADAADLVMPYLTPFDCWSMWEYGLMDELDEPDGAYKIINTPAKAAALLAILDRTVGGEDGAIIPDGLQNALAHVASLYPKLEKDARFQRLVTLNRR
jgi:hypothetical protein